MDHRPLLDGDVAYESTLGAAEAEALVAAARDRHRERLAALGRLRGDPDALTVPIAEPEPTAWERLWTWLGGVVGRGADEGSELDRLERRLEAAQKRVLEIAHAIDRVRADCAALRAEMADLRRHAERADRDARKAAEAVIELGHALEACQAGMAKAADRAALDALRVDEKLLEGLVAAREAERATWRTLARRLESVVALDADFLQLQERLHASLCRLHEAGTDALDTLDRHVGRLAARAQADDLARAVAGAMEGLSDSVQRVDLAAAESSALLLDSLDRLTDEVDLLAPPDPQRLLAHAEVAAALKPASIADLVARARAEVGRRGV